MFDYFALDIVALFVALAHGEGLAGKVAARDDEFKEIVLGDYGKNYADARIGKGFKLLFAVYVVHLSAVFGNEVGNICVKFADTLRNVLRKGNFRGNAVYYNICFFALFRL